MATGAAGAVADSNAAVNPLGGVSTGIGVSQRAGPYDGPPLAQFPFTPGAFGVLHYIGSGHASAPPAGELLSLNPAGKDLRFNEAAADVAPGGVFPDGRMNLTPSTCKAGQAVWAVEP